MKSAMQSKPDNPSTTG